MNLMSFTIIGIPVGASGAGKMYCMFFIMLFKSAMNLKDRGLMLCHD